MRRAPARLFFVGLTLVMTSNIVEYYGVPLPSTAKNVKWRRLRDISTDSSRCFTFMESRMKRWKRYFMILLLFNNIKKRLHLYGNVADRHSGVLPCKSIWYISAHIAEKSYLASDRKLPRGLALPVKSTSLHENRKVWFWTLVFQEVPAPLSGCINNILTKKRVAYVFAPTCHFLNVARSLFRWAAYLFYSACLVCSELYLLWRSMWWQSKNI